VLTFLLLHPPTPSKRLKKPHLKGQKMLQPNNPQRGVVLLYFAMKIMVQREEEKKK
jgi:hypothetical protein